MARRILLLDDDALFRTMVGQHLESRGHTVLRAASGAQASAEVANGPPDLFIVDGLLPDISGMDWIAKHRDQIGARPVLFVSAFWKDAPTHKKLTGLGVAHVLSKPIDPAALVERVEEELARLSPAAGDSAEAEELDLGMIVEPEPVSSDPEDLQLIRRDAARTLSAKIRELEEATRKVQGPAELTALVEARVRCQKLAALAAGCLFEEIALSAREHEAELKRLRPGVPAGAATFAALLARVEQMLARVKLETSPSWEKASRGRVLVALTDDSSTRKYLRAVLPRSLCQLRLCGSLEEAVLLAQRETVDAVLIDGGITGELSGGELVDLIRSSPGHQALPLGFIAGGDAKALLRSAREKGIKIWIPRPIARDTVVQAVCALLGTEAPGTPRVAVVVQDSMREEIGFWLARFGIDGRVLELGPKAAETLWSEKPAGVLVHTGPRIEPSLEFIRSIRARTAWEDLPVVVVSGADNAGRLALVDAGADDVLPFSSELTEQMAVLRQRIDRMVRIEARLTQDRVTGLPSRRGFLEDLSRRIAEARRCKESLIVSLCRVEGLPDLAQRHGVRAVDAVLGDLGQAVEFRIRTEDLRGCWAEGTFALALPGAELNDVSRVMSRILPEAGPELPQLARYQFKPKFTVSSAILPKDGTSILELLQVARERMPAP